MMMCRASISEEDAAASILSAPLPLVIIDTCVLGDIFRGVLEGRAKASISVLDWLCSCRTRNEFHLVIPSQVMNEFYVPGQFVNRELEPFKTAANKWNAVLEAYVSCARFPRVSGINPNLKIDIDMVGKLYSAVLNEIGKVFEVSIVFESSSEAQKWARNRQLISLKPAKRGKDSFGDCEICGSALSLMAKLRASGFVENAYFVSPNKSDYMQGNRLHPDLQDDFTAIQLNYTASILDVMGELFRRESISQRGKSKN